jgi:hypothetical protein
VSAHRASDLVRALARGFAALALVATVALASTRSVARAAPADSLATAKDSLVTQHDEVDSFVVMPPGWGEGRNYTPLTTDDAVAVGSPWLRAPFGEDLLTDPDAWDEDHPYRIEPLLSYDRVDQVDLGIRYQIQAPDSHYPRLGARYEYSFGRERGLYGVQVEQPLLSGGWLSVGATFVRVTDHSELHQVDDFENTLDMLFAHQDFRDYFEREGYGAYLSSRIPSFSTVSVHYGSYEYRSLPTLPGTVSWLNQDATWRPNPPIADGEAHMLSLRLERLAHRTKLLRAGLYHWIELERAGGGLGGDFDYTRLLADVRSVVRVSPATTLALRLVGGSGLAGDLTPQREFTAGGVDGLRAHSFSEFRGNQLALGQAEYSISLWRPHTQGFQAGLEAIVFLDTGKAWEYEGNAWNPGGQKFATDGGFGIGTSEDNLRVYFAKDLQEPGSPFVISARLQRPF